MTTAGVFLGLVFARFASLRFMHHRPSENENSTMKEAPMKKNSVATMFSSLIETVWALGVAMMAGTSPLT